ncbi:hypothetical protein [Georgenia wangjunii]|uniref:hypothetical protein n=1 Tax=Georgenia wangjunii TaxID=3117730 RepID=UPI002F269990
MVDRQHPRRPAVLDAAGAELIEGDVDPAVASELAHSTARVVVFGGGEDAEDAELAGRLVALVDSEGLDSVAELWSRSPATTLPGALWRVYLVREWLRRAPETIAERFRDGVERTEASGAEEDLELVPDPDEVSRVADDLFAGRSGPIDTLFERVASFLRVLAAGAVPEPEWVTHDDELASVVTRRAGSLVATAEELELVAETARAGRLD